MPKHKRKHTKASKSSLPATTNEKRQEVVSEEFQNFQNLARRVFSTKKSDLIGKESSKRSSDFPSPEASQ